MEAHSSSYTVVVRQYIRKWYGFPVIISIPAGWKYKRCMDREYQTAGYDMDIDLEACDGWLEIVNEEEKLRILNIFG